MNHHDERLDFVGGLRTARLVAQTLAFEEVAERPLWPREVATSLVYEAFNVLI